MMMVDSDNPPPERPPIGMRRRPGPPRGRLSSQQGAAGSGVSPCTTPAAESPAGAFFGLGLVGHAQIFCLVPALLPSELFERSSKRAPPFLSGRPVSAS